MHLKISALCENFKVQGLSKEWSLACSVRYLERGRFASKACVDFAIHYSFKVKCAKNWYRDVSSCVLRTLKGFCMAKSVVDLDVNIVLSKYGFIGAVAFSNIVGLTEISIFTCIYLNLQKLCSKMYLPFCLKN